MKVRQQGFGTLEALLIIFVLGLIGFAGWFVYKSQKNVSNTYDKAAQAQDETSGSASTGSTQQTYTDSAKIYTVNYPSSWKTEFFPGGADGIKTTDWSKVSRPVALESSNHQPNAQGEVDIQAGDPDNFASIIPEPPDQFNKVSRLTINGYDAVYDQLDFVGPDKAEKYLDHIYIITHNTQSVYFRFRERYYHNYPPQDWNDSQDVAAFNSIVRSIKFLN